MAGASPQPLWLVSRRGIDLAIVSAPTPAQAAAVVRQALSGLAATIHLQASRVGSARLGVNGIVRVLSSKVAGHDQRDVQRYYALLSGAASAVDIDPAIAARSHHPRATAVRWAAWFVAAEEMSMAAIGRASRHHHTTIRTALQKVRANLAASNTNTNLVAAIHGARQAAASLQRAEMS